ncbi:hypothetical protein GCM10022211_14190 [Sphingomonas humi]|uniref:Uncharacterized protein n=1 Tax=Sphingomonas humi TaxID=335630 RepID=A0ABP7RXF1_9SPHN
MDREYCLRRHQEEVEKAAAAVNEAAAAAHERLAQAFKEAAERPEATNVVSFPAPDRI